MFSLASVFLGLKMQWKRIIMAAVISAFASYFVRHLPIYFGMHYFIGLIVNGMLIYYFFHKDFFYSFCTSLIVLGCLFMAENIITYPIIYALGYNGFQEIWDKTLLRIIIAYPSLIVLCIVAWILKVKKYNIFGQRKSGNE
ncbi:hypothetical protein [Desulfocucumis palustris]|uniref:hypothetical protein n=1 Tax=Desulfocucumis palustris TaxID=1898651 RepID=UPI0013FDA78E|nr:hypothetical protein [Desulfocucumis palustris]